MKTADLKRAYGSAGRELRALLLSMDLSTFNSAKAQAIKSKARRIVSYMRALSGRWTRDVSRREYAKAEVRTLAVLARLGKKRPRGPEPSKPGHERVVAATEKTLLRATKSIITTVDQYVSAVLSASNTVKKIAAVQLQAFDYSDIADEVKRMATKAVKDETTRLALKKQVMDKLRGIVGEDNFIVVKGRRYNLSKYADLVSSVVIRNAQTAATVDLCKKYENDLVKVSSHHTDCPICAPYEGNIYSLSGSDKTYPELPEGGPTWHPFCKHSITPTSYEEIAVRGRGI